MHLFWNQKITVNSHRFCSDEINVLDLKKKIDNLKK
jgi:hypothetical protein